MGVTSLRILVVDDDDSVRAFLQELFELRGAVVWSARDPDEARTLAGGFVLDVAIVDLHRGNKESTPSFVADLRRLQPNLKIVFMSGSLERAPSGEDCVAKPFELEELLRAVGLCSSK